MVEFDDKYWFELYPFKSYGLPFLFEIQMEKIRREYYLSDQLNGTYKVYTLSENEDLIGQDIISQLDVLKVVKDNFTQFWHKNINALPYNRPEPFLKSKYGKHTMYVASEYKEIVRILINTLANQNYYFVSSSYDDIKQYSTDYYFSDILNNLDPVDFSTTAFLFKTEINEGWPGCLITVRNVPLSISMLSDLEEPLYDWIFEKIEDIPCMVEFDFNYLSQFSFGDTIFERFITPFYLELTKFNIKSVLLSVDNNAFYIKTNKIISDDERLQKLFIYTGEIIDPRHNTKLVEHAKETLGVYWDKLSDVSKLTFPVGLGLYNIYKTYQGDILDSAPASIQFSKLIETEIEQKLLLPFRDYFIKCDYNKTDIENDCNDSQVARMTKFLIKPKSKAPELGTFAYFLSVVINSKSRANTSPTIISYKSYLSSFKIPEFLYSEELYDKLTLITNKYRNGSAHTKALSFEYLDEFYNMLIGTNRDGLAFKLLESLEINER